MGLFNKKELSRINELEGENKKLKETLDSFGGMNRFELEQEDKKIQESIKLKKSELDSINAKIVEAQSKLFDLNDDIDLQDFALYTPKYDCMDSNEYSEKITACRQEQKYMIRNKMALAYSDN